SSRSLRGRRRADARPRPRGAAGKRRSSAKGARSRPWSVELVANAWLPPRVDPRAARLLQSDRFVPPSFPSQCRGRRSGSPPPPPVPALVTPDDARPAVDQGVSVGDVRGDRAIVWSRTDRPARMIVEWSTKESFEDVRRVVGPAALEDTGFTARLDL